MKTWFEREDKSLWQQSKNKSQWQQEENRKLLLGEQDADEVLDFIQGLKRLEGVNPDYLAPFPDMLPPESIRFFYVDENWIDYLVKGALSTGGEEESAWGKELRNKLNVNSRTGFLLRSVLVKAFPSITVTAKEGERELKVERLAYLGEDVLIGIVQGDMDSITFIEPEESLMCEFCYNEKGELCAGEEPVKFREGTVSGVVDIKSMAEHMERQGEFTAAEFGRLLLRDQLEYSLGIGGGRQMRSIFGMPSDELAGDAKRRVPIPYTRRNADE